MHQHIFESIKQTKWAKLVLLLTSHVKWKDSCSTFLKVHNPKLQLCFLYMLLQHSYSRHCFSLSKKTCNSCFLLIKFNVINLFAHRLFLTITTKSCNILTISSLLRESFVIEHYKSNTFNQIKSIEMFIYNF